MTPGITIRRRDVSPAIASRGWRMRGMSERVAQSVDFAVCGFLNWGTEDAKNRDLNPSGPRYSLDLCGNIGNYTGRRGFI